MIGNTSLSEPTTPTKIKDEPQCPQTPRKGKRKLEDYGATDERIDVLCEKILNEFKTVSYSIFNSSLKTCILDGKIPRFIQELSRESSDNFQKLLADQICKKFQEAYLQHLEKEKCGLMKTLPPDIRDKIDSDNDINTAILIQTLYFKNSCQTHSVVHLHLSERDEIILRSNDLEDLQKYRIKSQAINKNIPLQEDKSKEIEQTIQKIRNLTITIKKHSNPESAREFTISVFCSLDKENSTYFNTVRFENNAIGSNWKKFITWLENPSKRKHTVTILNFDDVN